MVVGPGGEQIERLPADAAGRHVHDAGKRLVIPRIFQQPEPGHDISDLAALEELEPADELVGNAAAAQRHFERPRQSVRAE